MEVLIKLNTQTAGRDKIARLLQYLSRLLWHRLKQSHCGGVDNLKNLEYQLSTFRKLLRFGRFADSLYTTLPLFQHHNTTIKLTVILSKIANALFLFADHILWMGRSDVMSVNTDKWAKISNKYWLYSITMNLVRDFYEIRMILKHNQSKIYTDRVCSVQECLTVCKRAFDCVQHDKAVMIDTVKNVCDFFIPLNALGHVKLSPGTVGLLGVISSIAGLIVLMEPHKKLSPQ
ncbi:peroxisomal membrane protein 11B [Atheta coriaria]|uniref:peroxisomal membrane protein 11B n=1 Tax=Dalotia coriaria TaxID=877792 RepID=UPI0031F43326